MDVYIHDYAGHIGQFEVARALAQRGHRVVFSYCDELPTPRGELRSDPLLPSLTVEPISIGRPIIKRNYVTRQWQDVLYSRALVQHLRRQRPQLVVSANNPLIPQRSLVRHCRQRRVPVIHWWTDIYGLAVRDGLRGKFGPLGKVVAAKYEALEGRLLNEAQGVLAIAEHFRAIAEKWNVVTPLTIIPVAAPTDRIQPLPKCNEWSRRHQVADTLNVLYCGTLAIKHQPEVLLRLAKRLAHDPSKRVIVVAEGVGAEWLRSQQSGARLPNLLMLPFQPFEDYAKVLASADVQITLLSEAASAYATPSKVLSQLCSARAQLALLPKNNPAAGLIEAAAAGVVHGSDEIDAAFDSMDRLLNDEARRKQLGESGRSYVEQNLSLPRLIDRYEKLFAQVVSCGQLVG